MANKPISSSSPKIELFTIHSRSMGGKAVGSATTLKGARKAVDRRDNAYGGYDHYILDSTGKRRI